MDRLPGPDAHFPETSGGMAWLDRRSRFRFNKGVFRWFLGCALHPLCAQADPEIVLWVAWRFSGDHRPDLSAHALGREHHCDREKEIKRKEQRSNQHE